MGAFESDVFESSGRTSAFEFCAIGRTGAFDAIAGVLARACVYARMRMCVRERLLFVAVIVVTPIRFVVFCARTHARFFIHAPVVKIPVRVA